MDPNIRQIDLSYNTKPVYLYESIIDAFMYLITLNVSYCQIGYIPPGVFDKNHNLLYLDMSYNQISTLYSKTFYGLWNLKLLVLLGNPLTIIESFAFDSLQLLTTLSLESHKINIIFTNTFFGLKGLETLNISNNQLIELPFGIFNGLEVLKHLDISGNDISKFNKEDFQSLVSLKSMNSDEYMFCCFVYVETKNCKPKPDVLSSCSDLMSNNILRIFLWLLGSSALLGNLFVIIWRIVSNEKFRVPTFLVWNLAVADLLMGVYMVTIACVDLYYRGVYIENDKAWKNSPYCQFLGIISTISSEMSVLCLALITIDRLINITAPFSSWILTMKSVKIVVVITWALIILMALIPLFPTSYFQGDFYSR